MGAEELKRQEERRKKEALFGKIFAESKGAQNIPRIDARRLEDINPLDELMKEDARNRQLNQPKQEKKKQQVFITLGELEKMNVKQFNRNVRADFKPRDFLIESDDEKKTKSRRSRSIKISES